jgi:hypothetical protein
MKQRFKKVSFTRTEDSMRRKSIDIGDEARKKHRRERTHFVYCWVSSKGVCLDRKRDEKKID